MPLIRSDWFCVELVRNAASEPCRRVTRLFVLDHSLDSSWRTVTRLLDRVGSCFRPARPNDVDGSMNSTNATELGSIPNGIWRSVSINGAIFLAVVIGYCVYQHLTESDQSESATSPDKPWYKDFFKKSISGIKIKCLR